MLAVIWITFLLGMLFLLGSAVGSFLNVCIVRLPAGRSLIRPASCCGHCNQPILMRDNLPLLSYWLLRGRCRACGAPFSMRYFWIELLTGIAFVVIFHLEIGRNIHHFGIWGDSGYWHLYAGFFTPLPWLVFAAHALMVSFLIVATMCTREQHKVPGSVTISGVLVGLAVAVLCPWPWPDPLSAIRHPLSANSDRGLGWMADSGERMPAGLYPWPIWGPLPDWLPPGSWQLGLATGLAGVLAGAIFMGLVRLLFNAGVGTAALGWGETSLMMIAGAFLGWQSVVVAALLALVPGLTAALCQWTGGEGRGQVSCSLWLALALVPVWLGWCWIGPFVQGTFFNETRLLLLAGGYGAALLAFAACLRLGR